MLDEERRTTWVATITEPARWLQTVAWKRGFTPKQDPILMSYADTERAVANVLCPSSLATDRGVGVSYCQSVGWQGWTGDSCLVVLFSSRPVTLAEAASEFFPTMRDVYLEPAYGSAGSLRRLLETGGRYGNAVGRVLWQGLPIREK